MASSRRDVILRKDQMTSLGDRKGRTGIGIGAQIYQAIEAELARPVEAASPDQVLPFDKEEDEVRFGLSAPQEMWDSLHKRKALSGLNIESIVQLAVDRWIGTELPPATITSADKSLRDLVIEEFAGLREELAKKPVLPEDLDTAIIRAVRAALDDDTVRVDLPQEQRPILSQLAQKWGFVDISSFLVGIAVRAMNSPDAAESFLKGSTREAVKAHKKQKANDSLETAA